MTELILLRHAESVSREGLNHQQAMKVGLSTIGRFQSWVVGMSLRSAQVEQIISSPFARTVETAEIISRLLGVPFTIDAALEEFCVSRAVYRGSDFKIEKAKKRENVDYRGIDGESLNDSVARFKRFLDTLPPRSGSVLLVTHSLLIQNVLHTLVGVSEFATIEHAGHVRLSWNEHRFVRLPDDSRFVHTLLRATEWVSARFR